MKENYPKAYTEVVEILKYMPQDDVNKIPKDMMKVFFKNRDISYNFVVNENDDFSNLNIMKETEAIFVNIFRDYWATPEQRDNLIAKQINDIKKIEAEKMKKFYNDNIFKKKNQIEEGQKDNIQNWSSNLPEKCKESIFSKFINFVKKLKKR